MCCQCFWGGNTTFASTVSSLETHDYDVATVADASLTRDQAVPGQIIVKFKDASPVAMRAPRATRFTGSRVKAVDDLFSAIGVEEVEQLMPLTGSQPVKKLAKGINGKTVPAPRTDKLFVLRLKANAQTNVYEAIQRLQASGEVEYAEPNYLVHATASEDTPNDPLYPQQWALQAINLPMLWGQEVISKEGPVIAILATGVATEPPDLKMNIWTNERETAGMGSYDDDGNGFTDDVCGWDFISNTGIIQDYNGHGTHCAGIAACGFNGLGIIGANPYARIMPVTVMQSNGTGDLATLIKGLDYATANGASIISMSLGSYATSLAFEEALGRAYQKSILMAAAGNDGYCLNHAHPERGQSAPMPMFPAAYTFVLGVQSSTDPNGLASFSNYDDDGPVYSPYSEDKLYNYEIVAPGVNVLSTYPGGQYKPLNGTSMACPLVAGALSRLLQSKEVDNKEELFADLISTANNGVLDIAAVYAMTDDMRHPNLQLVSTRIDDTAGDGDGRPDAGETIALYPTLRNVSGHATNIQYTLEWAEEGENLFCEILDSKADFGSELNAYAKNESATPIRIRFNDNVADGRICRFKLTATCDDLAAPVEQEIEFVVENGVEIGGVILEDMTLHAGVHYIVTSPIAVPDGVTLTIEPGTILRFKGPYGISIAKSGNVIAHGEPGRMIVFDGTGANFQGRSLLEIHSLNYQIVFKYCKFQNFYGIHDLGYFHEKGTSFENCIVISNTTSLIFIGAHGANSQSCCIYNNFVYRGGLFQTSFDCKRSNTNIIKNESSSSGSTGGNNSVVIENCNIYNNTYLDKLLNFDIPSSVLGIKHMDLPSYWGSTKETFVRVGIWDIKQGYGFAELDLSNMLTRPVAEAHGIVWKVVVNGYDAQDEFDMLPPLGVGRHKVEVYFNRPMNTKKAPTVAMGVRPPYTQRAIAEDGSWNEAGDVYTAYVTLTGREKIDGINRIYVADAEDDEFFEIPVEDIRFNLNVQSAGSMSSNFFGEAGLGRVNLEWEQDDVNLDDMMGYNLYRYAINDEGQIQDTLQLNRQLLDPTEKTFTDYDVTPGTTYCYFYRIMTTDLSETDPSKTVAVTPMTSAQGDANGSGDVDVADVVTTVNYASGMNPKPFIFEAADMNADKDIDVLDVVGIIHAITHPAEAEARTAGIASVAEFYVQDGIVYVDSPVELAGVQLNLVVNDDAKVTPLEALDGFEHTGSGLGANRYVFLAYNLSNRTLPAGKHALLSIGNAEVKKLVLSDAAGHNVEVMLSSVTGIANPEAFDRRPDYAKGIYNGAGIKLGEKAKDVDRLPAGFYIVNGKKVVK